MTQRVSVVEDFGERRDCLDQEWTTLLEDLGHTPIPLPNSVNDGTSHLTEMELDSLVLTSGNDLSSLEYPANPAPERDRFETEALEYAIDTGLPVLGVCRGLELLNTYFGGSLASIDGHVATTHAVEFTNEKSGFEFPNRVIVNSYHDYAIPMDGVGDELQVLGKSPDDSVECMVHSEYPIWGIMWHPERQSPSKNLDRQLLNHVLGGN
nr:gamma-glutamyl-gamma-aminobutyrate hydrolase family protein [Natronomonas gomsonensis]